jgi:hypothetical protein
MDLILGVSIVMVFCCHSCGCQIPVLRLNGTPKEFQCSGCQAVYRVSVERLRPPASDKRVVKASEYVRG